MRTIVAGVPLLVIAVALTGCNGRPGAKTPSEAQVVVKAPGMT